MAKRKLALSAVIIVLLAAALWSNESTAPPAGSSDPAQKLNQAILDLRNPQKIARRHAAQEISALILTPGIQRAINPLADVLLNQGQPSGIFTQMIAAETLGRIAARLGAPAGDGAVEALIECLETEGFDTVRSACAQGLGLAQDELSVEPLQLSLQNDGSPLVKYEAQAALERLAQAGISLASVSLNLSADALPQPALDQAQIYQYLKAHTLYAHPALEEGKGRP